jgi:hypothetical protein
MIPSRSYFGDAGSRDSGEILLVINKEATNPDSILLDLAKKSYQNGYDDGRSLDHDESGICKQVAKFLEDYEIFPKVTKSITTSGRYDKRDV